MATFTNLDGHRYISLVTYRKNGERVPTPVWFADENGTLYVITMAISGKVTRIRNNAQVEVAPCTNIGDVLGDAIPAMARVLQGEDEIKLADSALERKYGEEKARAQANSSTLERVFLAIKPA
jgi:uncharacterized protein